MGTNIGLNIQNAREKKSLKSKEAANLIGVSPSTWSLYESNKRIPSFQTMIIIARKLNTSLDVLAGLKEDKNVSRKAI